MNCDSSLSFTFSSIASANSWIISPAAGARMWAPTIRVLCVTTITAPSGAPSVRARSLWIRSWRQTSTSDCIPLGLGLGHARVRELGIGERAPRDTRDDLALAREEHVADGAHPLVGGGVREQVPAGDVARRVDRFDTGAAAVVDDDALRSGLDPQLLEAEVLDVGLAADRDEELVGGPGRGPAVLGAVDDLLAVLDRDAVGLDVEAEVDALLTERVDEQVDERGLVARRMRGPFCRSATGMPSRVNPCTISTAIGPPPMLTKLAGGSVSSKRLSLVT